MAPNNISISGLNINCGTKVGDNETILGLTQGTVVYFLVNRCIFLFGSRNAFLLNFVDSKLLLPSKLSFAHARIGYIRLYSDFKLYLFTEQRLSMMDKKSNLIWIDLEMSGLVPEVNHILEIATLVTDKDLNIIAEGPSLVTYQPDGVLDAMDEWCTTHHGNSGLTEKVRNSTTSVSEAEEQTLSFVEQWVEKGASPLCGNSIWQDRRFLIKYMPRLDAFCHYRNIDVSTLKELAARWRPEIMAGFNKKGSHRALDDILESIDELKYYRTHFIKNG